MRFSGLERVKRDSCVVSAVHVLPEKNKFYL